MIDPIVQLAFAIHATPAAYAVLLGSGTSRSAGIPTGWEVLTGLIEQVALLEGATVEGDPAAWYASTKGREPDYSELLGSLARTPPERQSLLRGFFEPTEEERERGLKAPTPAHRALARLVARGSVKVILTTNFDRLLERALEDEGIAPTVISTADMAEGAPPLAHTRCVVAKLHGDYLDTRIRNTADELAAYDARINSLLDRILDEYGLIVCGWSGEWDAALRDAIGRCKSHRYATFWATRSSPTPLASDLVNLRRGEVVTIASADDFFVELEEKVASLAESNAPHPATAKLLVATLKRYLPDPTNTIRVHDLIVSERERVFSATSDESFPLDAELTSETYLARVRRLEAVTEPLAQMMAVGCYWGTDAQRPLWRGVLDRLANRPDPTGTLYERWVELRPYPTTLCLYGGGIGALMGGQFETLKELVTVVRMRTALLHGDEPMVFSSIPVRVLHQPTLRPNTRESWPVASDHMFEVTKDALSELEPNEARFTECFDDFEYLLGLVVADLRGIDDWGPYGSFAWRSQRGDGGPSERLRDALAASGDGHPLLRLGLFGGSADRVAALQEGMDQRARAVGW